MGKILIVVGLVAVVAGLIIQFLLSRHFHGLGNYRDIRYEKEILNSFFPLTTMILLSVGVSLLLKLFGR